MTTEVNLSDDMIDVRDVIARVKELESEIEDAADITEKSDLQQELAQLASILDDLKGYGGDEQYKGDWYPITLIRDSYFVTYAEELADDIGAIDSEKSWPLYCIDWKRAANDLKVDYSAVEINGVTYWYR